MTEIKVHRSGVSTDNVIAGNQLGCLRCGRCCMLHSKNTNQTKKCRHLVVLSSGRTLCRIYNKKDRLGSFIGVIDGEKRYCVHRSLVETNYKDCPFNRPEWAEGGEGVD